MIPGNGSGRRTVTALVLVLLLVASVAAGCGGRDPGGGAGPVTSTSAPAPATSGRGSAATTTTPTSLAPRPLRSFDLATTGDFLLHMPVQRRALAYGGGTHDFSPMVSEISGEISSADLALCHLETPLSTDDSALTGYPIFNSAHEIVDAVAAAGWDTCSTASNHSLDQGPKGVATTLEQLDRVNLGHVGTARSATEAATPDLHDAGGVRVAHLNYTYGTNGIPVPADQPWLVNLIDIDQILDDAHAARAAGAEIVVVEMHWGTENQALPTTEQRTQATSLLDSPDVDLVVGQHAHVVQAAERQGSKFVIYGTGNLLSNQGAPTTPVASNDGVIVHVAFAEQPDGSWAQTVSYTPTYVDRTSFVIRRATPTSNPESYQRTVAALNGLGPGTFDGTPTA